MRVWLLLALLLSLPASAAPNCESLDEDAFRTLFLDALAAIDRDDAELHAQIVAEVRSRVPCMTFAPPPRLWADFLVGVAVVEFSKQGDWQTPMAAALRIRPNVDRLVSGAHPINRWEPPVVAAVSGPAVPEGRVLWVDGSRAEYLPPRMGLFLVQKEQDGWFETQLVENESVGLDWLNAPVERPTRLETWLYVGGGLGVGAVGQTANFEATSSGFEPPEFSDYLPSDAWAGVMPRATIDGMVIFGRVGFFAHAELSWGSFARATATNGHAGPIVTLGPLIGLLGVGLQSFDVWEGGCHITHPDPTDPEPGFVPATVDECRTVATARGVALPYGYGGLWLRAEKPWAPQPRLVFGAGPYAGRFEASVDLEPPPTRKGARWRHGTSLLVSMATFARRERTHVMAVSPFNLQLGVHTGMVFGRVR